MATFLTCVVAFQLGLGFLALLSAMREAHEGYEDETGFHFAKSKPNPIYVKPAPKGVVRHTPALLLRPLPQRGA